MLEPRTVLFCLIAVALTTGALLLISSRQNRDEPSLIYWGAANIVGALGLALAGLRDLVHDRLTIDLANALILVGYMLSWAGMRRFCHRAAPPAVIAVPAAIWLALNQWPAFHGSVEWRIAAASSLVAAISSATAATLWALKGERLVSRGPAIAWLILQALVFVGRIPPALVGSAPDGGTDLASPLVILVLFSGLIHVTMITFMQLSLAKERAENRYREAAETDMLTGLPNRRAFFGKAGPMVEAAVRERRPACILVVDIDRFKAINDSLGHAGGDIVLIEVARAIEAHLRPGDLAGRLGGEEFGCLLPDTPMQAGTAVAEALRARIAALDIRTAGTAIRVSASIGLAVTDETTRRLDHLLSEADAGLYQAKRAGRDRVVAMDIGFMDAR